MRPKGFKYLIYLMIQNFPMLKKYILLFVLVFVMPLPSIAQKKQNTDNSVTRCYTMERMKQYLQSHPATKTLSKKAPVKLSGRNNYVNTFRSANIEEIINIPVIFHIVLPNPYIISDATIQSQIDELNIDYAGANADSTNAVAFYTVRGHSARIRFVLAKRTPGGGLSNGINRIKSSTSSNVNLFTDPIKRTALGGADVWDPFSYLNIWVGDDISGRHVLGYAQFPQSGLAADDGIFCSYTSLGISSCNSNSYNRGRTLCHEAGHYFGLYHIWGDDDLCAGDDFRSLTDAGSAAVLPAGLFNEEGQGNTIFDIGDTPNQSVSSTTCLAGIVPDVCSTGASGKMYQNYMDYTPDNCYSLFTKKQVQRMEWVIDNARSGLKTSLGATVPTGAIALDALPSEAVNPGGAEAKGCTSVSYPSILSCPGTIIPKMRIRNNGADTLTSVTAGLLVNGVAQIPVQITIAKGLALGASMVVSFPSIMLTSGTYTLKFFTYNANGIPTDQVPANDTLTTTVSISNGIVLPIYEGFQNLPFPANNWLLYNPDGDASWTSVNKGSNSTTSMTIDNFSKNNTGLIDELRTPKFLISPADSVVITFDLAYKNYPGRSDELSVLVSNNCGATWTTVFAKAGSALSTAGATTLAYTTPIISDWKNQKITIGGAILSTGKILIAFRNKGGYGNNIYIDNINIFQQYNRDISPAIILSPDSLECSSPIAAPQLIVRNNGKQIIAGFKIGYLLNNGAAIYKNFIQNIAPGSTAIVTLDPLVAPAGFSTIKIFTADPVSASGHGDENLINDTLSKTFTINTIVETPLLEGFEALPFAPLHWDIINSGSANTWQRKSPGNNSGYAAFIDNFSNDFTGETDALKSPSVNVAGADSVIISFDLAYKNFEGSNDKLQVKISTDCGETFTTVFDKSGAGLSTAGSSPGAYLKPVANDWKTQRIVLDSTFTASGTIIVAFENTADYGNNIFIDNINISKLFKRDFKLVAVKQPIDGNCSTGPFMPVVTISNAGVETITAFKIAYSIDNGSIDTTTITGISLAANQQTNITLNTFNSTVGNHIFKVYSLAPVTASGTGDLYPMNDTLNVPFVIVGIQPTLPLMQGFEGTSFPPPDWGIINPDGVTTWQQSSANAKTGKGAMVINNFTYAAEATTTDKFISPVISNASTNDSVFMAFDLAYKQGITYPGTTIFPVDTLEVQVTKDCGITFQTVWKKWGENLQTVNDPNSPNLTSFIPLSSDWKNINLYLTPYTSKENFQVYLVAKSNHQNNIWIDNINIYAKVLPKKLKEQDYLVYPNPFNNTFLVRHYKVPVNLQAVQVYNSTGQMVWDKWYNGNATTEMTVDLFNKANGVYVLKLVYNDKTILKKIIKL